MSETTPHLVLIDGTNMFTRAWSVVEREKNNAGTEIAATRLLSKMCLKLMHRMAKGSVPPTGVLIMFDPDRAHTWRRALSPDYKAHRDDYEDDMKVQWPLLKKMCEVLGVGYGMSDTFEADDMIAAYVEDARAQGIKTSVISTDKDLMQLVRKGVMQYRPAEDKWYNTAAVVEKFGVGPEMLGDFLALTGDAGDGVKGAPGIGEKTAAKLLGDFGSLEAILANTDQIKQKSWKKSLEENAEQIRLARKLVTLDSVNCPRPVAISTLKQPDPFAAGKAIEAWHAGDLLSYAPPAALNAPPANTQPASAPVPSSTKAKNLAQVPPVEVPVAPFVDDGEPDDRLDLF